MCRLALSLAVSFLVTSMLAPQAEARGRLFGGRHPVARTVGAVGHAVASIPAGCSNATAQGVAEIMARVGRVGHFGGNRGYEGCGMASSPQAAYGICCYANSGMRTVDVGYAQGANGMWYCCRRYGN
jgi:hypothetical protein